MPNFDKPDLVFYSSTNSGSIGATLSVTNTVGMVLKGVTQYLYASPDLSGDYIGQRITEDLTYTDPNGLSLGERVVSFYFNYGTMEGDLSILSVRNVGYSSDPVININRIVNGGGDFTFSEGNIVRIFLSNQNIYQYSVFFTNT